MIESEWTARSACPTQANSGLEWATRVTRKKLATTGGELTEAAVCSERWYGSLMLLDRRSQGSEALVEHELMLHGINWYTDFHQFLQRNLDRPELLILIGSRQQMEIPGQ